MPMKNKETLTIPLSDLGLDNSLPDPVTYQYYKNLKDRKIIINDQIDSSIVEMVMIPLLEMDNDGTGRPIEIILNTVGGSLFDGATLCNIIDNLKKWSETSYASDEVETDDYWKIISDRKNEIYEKQKEKIDFYEITQFLFYKQFFELKDYANKKVKY